MSVGKRRRKAAERIARARSQTPALSKMLRLCLNGCGEPGPHFCPPSLGEPGFFMCTPKQLEVTA